MERRRIAIVGWGRLGQACAAALHGSTELMLAGIVRREPVIATAQAAPARGAPCVAHISELGAIDAALLCVPAEVTAGAARELLQAGIAIVECAAFDAAALQRHQAEIAHMAKRQRQAAVVGAGWDPGLVDDLRRLFELLIPKGRTQLSRQVAAGLHHTAAAKGVSGVREALCSEVHDAAGGMRRYVYVQLEHGANAERVRQRIEADPLFAGAPTEVLPVADLGALEQRNRGVLIERLGEDASGPHASLVLEARMEASEFAARAMVDGARLLAPHARGGWRYTPFGLLPI